jgi:hypothetical protein
MKVGHLYHQWVIAGFISVSDAGCHPLTKALPAFGITPVKTGAITQVVMEIGPLSAVVSVNVGSQIRGNPEADPDSSIIEQSIFPPT